MVTTPATVALTRTGIRYIEHEYAHDGANTAFGIEAAAVLGIEPDRVFKTLLADVDGVLVVAIVPVSGRLDLRSLAATIGDYLPTSLNAYLALPPAFAATHRSAAGLTPGEELYEQLVTLCIREYFAA